MDWQMLGAFAAVEWGGWMGKLRALHALRHCCCVLMILLTGELWFGCWVEMDWHLFVCLCVGVCDWSVEMRMRSEHYAEGGEAWL